MTVLRPRIMYRIISLAMRSESPASTRSARSTTAGLGLRGRAEADAEPPPPEEEAEEEEEEAPGEPDGDAAPVVVVALAGVAGREREVLPLAVPVPVPVGVAESWRRAPWSLRSCSMARMRSCASSLGAYARREANLETNVLRIQERRWRPCLKPSSVVQWRQIESTRCSMRRTESICVVSGSVGSSTCLEKR
jgi:hypothetical protein